MMVAATPWPLLLGACAAFAPPQAEPGLIAGRLSLVVDAHGAEAARSFSGRFELRGDARSGALELGSPIGTLVARAQWSAGHYRLDDGQQLREYASLDELALGAFGEPLPLAAMFDWLRMRPWPGAPHRALTDARPGFVQLGWTVEAQDAEAGLLRLQREAPPRVTLRVRLDTEGVP